MLWHKFHQAVEYSLKNFCGKNRLPPDHLCRLLLPPSIIVVFVFVDSGAGLRLFSVFRDKNKRLNFQHLEHVIFLFSKKDKFIASREGDRAQVGEPCRINHNLSDARSASMTLFEHVIST